MNNMRAILKPLTMIVVHTMMLSVYNIRRLEYTPNTYTNQHIFIYVITFDNQQVRSWKLMRASTIFCLFNALGCMMNKNLKCFSTFYKCSFSIIIHDTNTEIGPTETLSSLFPSVRVSLSSCCWMLFITLGRTRRVKGT